MEMLQKEKTVTAANIAVAVDVDVAAVTGTTVFPMGADMDSIGTKRRTLVKSTSSTLTATDASPLAIASSLDQYTVTGTFTQLCIAARYCCKMRLICI